MKKWFVIVLAIGVITALLVPAYAYTTKMLTPDKQKEVDQLEQQMQDLRAQMLQKYVDAGVITKEEADAAQERMKERYDYRKSQGLVPGLGAYGAGGCGGAGCGSTGGCGGGRGFRGGAGQGYNAAPQANIVY